MNFCLILLFLHFLSFNMFLNGVFDPSPNSSDSFNPKKFCRLCCLVQLSQPVCDNNLLFVFLRYLVSNIYFILLQHLVWQNRWSRSILPLDSFNRFVFLLYLFDFFSLFTEKPAIFSPNCRLLPLLLPLQVRVMQLPQPLLHPQEDMVGWLMQIEYSKIFTEMKIGALRQQWSVAIGIAQRI